MRVAAVSVLAGMMVLVIAGCQYPPEGVTGPHIPEPVFSQGQTTQEYPIWAGQSILVGTLKITNDSGNLYVTYELFDGWMLEETHVHVASALSGIPCNRNGIPVPGQFAFSDVHVPVVTEYTYTIAMAPYGFQCGDQIVVAAHAVVKKWDEGSQTFQTETGWGGDNPGPGPRWWFYAVYSIQCWEEPEYSSETAWARMNDDPFDFTYPFNPDPSDPTKWQGGSWATFMEVEPNETPQVFYFYAGQFYRVGEVEISRDAGNLLVEVLLDAGFYLSEAHLKVSTESLTGTSSAPGQFPYKVEDLWTGAYTFAVPWNDDWNQVPLFIALHGVVWGDYEAEEEM